uniref:K Homology domain-containing protein n=1 Tax=Triticum urartu TaxID=4572 RepID=A0A8R7PYM0_TRIUA
MGEKYSSSLEVDVPLMRFLKGKGGSVQKQIEQETGVKIIFPSAKEETLVALEGKSAESIRKASERISKILGEVDIQRTALTDDYCMLRSLLNHWHCMCLSLLPYC